METTAEKTLERQAKYGGDRRAMYLTNFAALGMLPTPKAVEAPSASWENRKPNSKYKPGVTLTDLKIWGMLPTPTASDPKFEHIQPKYQGTLSQQIQKALLPTPTAGEGYKGGKTYNPNSQMGQGLSAMAGSGMLPTPKASDSLNGMEKESETYPRHTDLNNLVAQHVGKPSQLNPRFVAEMMGFPPGWTESPFQSGEPNH
jgi:hypothetical protein